MNKFLLCNEKIPKGPGQEVESTRARLMSCLNPHGGAGKVQGPCCPWGRQLLQQLRHSAVCGAGALWALTDRDGGMEWRSTCGTECHSQSVPILLPSLPKSFPVPCGLRSSSCTLPLTFCFICGYGDKFSAALFSVFEDYFPLILTVD